MPSTPQHRPLLLALLALTPALAGAAPASRYAVTDLGNIFPTGVNDQAWVSAYNGDALIWQPGQGLFVLASCAGCSNRANAINNAGQLTGFAYNAGLGAYRALRWSADGLALDMGDLPGGAAASRGDAINNQGWVAGQASGQYNGHPQYGYLSFHHASLHLSPDQVFDLGDLPGGLLSSIARGINDAGATVGQSSGGVPGQTSYWYAMHWSAAGAMSNLGALWGQTGDSFAYDINNLGQVALQLPNGSGGSQAAIWQADSGFSLIALLPGASQARAQAINDAGVAVGWAGPYGIAGSDAFVWSSASGTLRLDDRLDAQLGAGWDILDATGISENGHIVGRGWHPQLGYRGVLLSPVPEPAAAWLLTAGLALFCLQRRRRR